MATSLNPFCSNRLMISPTSPRWTPSGLMAMNVRSAIEAIVLRKEGIKVIIPGPAGKCNHSPVSRVISAVIIINSATAEGH